MTALVTESNRPQKNVGLQNYKVKGGTKIYKGALVMVSTDGYLRPCSSLASSVFAGVAFHSVDNSAGVDGQETVNVETEGMFLFDGSGFTEGDVKKAVYAADDNTVQTDAGSNLVSVGTIEEVVSPTQVWVKLNTYNRKA